MYIIEWNLYGEVLPSEYVTCLCSFLAHAGFKLKEFQGLLGIQLCFWMSEELSMQYITVIDGVGMSQRWISSTNYGTEKFQYEISNLSETTFSIFSDKISGHLWPLCSFLSSCKNDLKIISYQLLIV